MLPEPDTYLPDTAGISPVARNSLLAALAGMGLGVAEDRIRRSPSLPSFLRYGPGDPEYNSPIMTPITKGLRNAIPMAIVAALMSNANKPKPFDMEFGGDLNKMSSASMTPVEIAEYLEDAITRGVITKEAADHTAVACLGLCHAPPEMVKTAELQKEGAILGATLMGLFALLSAYNMFHGAKGAYHAFKSGNNKEGLKHLAWMIPDLVMMIGGPLMALKGLKAATGGIKAIQTANVGLKGVEGAKALSTGQKFVQGAGKALTAMKPQVMQNLARTPAAEKAIKMVAQSSPEAAQSMAKLLNSGGPSGIRQAVRVARGVNPEAAKRLMNVHKLVGQSQEFTPAYGYLQNAVRNTPEAWSASLGRRFGRPGAIAGKVLGQPRQLWRRGQNAIAAQAADKLSPEFVNKVHGWLGGSEMSPAAEKMLRYQNTVDTAAIAPFAASFAVPGILPNPMAEGVPQRTPTPRYPSAPVNLQRRMPTTSMVPGAPRSMLRFRNTYKPVGGYLQRGYQ